MSGAEREQRAFVQGFASEAAARAIGALTRADRRPDRRADGLEFAVLAPGAGPGRRVAVSLLGGSPVVFAGHDARRAEIRCFRGRVGPEALAVLSRAPWVSAIDTVWGRGPVLWAALREALAALP